VGAARALSTHVARGRGMPATVEHTATVGAMRERPWKGKEREGQGE